MEFKLAGVLASEPDQRDYLYSPRSLSFPAEVSHEQHIVEIENQLSQGACVGNGICSSLETQGHMHSRAYDLARQFIYNAGRSLEGRLGQEGMYVRTGIKIPQKFGVPDESDYPYFTNANKNENPPPEIYALAAQKKTRRYELGFLSSMLGWGNFETDRKINIVRAMLDEGLCPVIGLGVTGSIYDMQGPRRNHAYVKASPSVPVIGGHLMSIIGYSEKLRGFLIQNSWGQSWGDYGIGLFPWEIVSEPFCEVWVQRGFDGTPEWEMPGVKLERKNWRAITFRIVPEFDEIGRRVKVWIGALFPDKRLYLNRSLTGDNWSLQQGSDYQPAGEIILSDDNPLQAVHSLDLGLYPGTKIYVAYGTSPLDWKLQELCQL